LNNFSGTSVHLIHFEVCVLLCGDVKDPLGDGLAGVPEVALPAVPRDQLQQDCHERPTHGDMGNPLLYHPSPQGVRRFSLIFFNSFLIRVIWNQSCSFEVGNQVM
jgi:hypothetical protein